MSACAPERPERERDAPSWTDPSDPELADPNQQPTPQTERAANVRRPSPIAASDSDIRPCWQGARSRVRDHPRRRCPTRRTPPQRCCFYSTLNHLLVVAARLTRVLGRSPVIPDVARSVPKWRGAAYFESTPGGTGAGAGASAPHDRGDGHTPRADRGRQTTHEGRGAAGTYAREGRSDREPVV